MKYKFRRTAAAMLSLLLCAFYLCAAASASYSYPAISDLDSLCSLTLDMGEPSVTVRIYRVAEVTADVRFILTGDFAGYPVDLENLTSADWAVLAQTLRSYVFLDDIQPLRAGVSDETGHIVFTDLPVGLYLVDGDRVGSAEEGYRQPAPFMICLPNWERMADPETGAESGGWQYSVSARPKYTTLDGGIIMRRVLKVWEDGGSAGRPAQISVSLLKDGAVYDTVDLNAENNWRYAWDELDGDSDWQIVETGGSGGYTVSTSLQGLTFVVTNTFRPPVDPPVNPPVNPPVDPPDHPTDDPTIDPPSVPPTPGVELPDDEVPLDQMIPDPDPDTRNTDDPDPTIIKDSDIPRGKLPQTGQLWWPVPLLAMGGMMMLLLGIIYRRRSRGDEE